MKITDRKIHNFAQGSPEWHAHRRHHYNASVLAAAMGLDPDCPRNELVRMLATGDEKTFSEFTQRMILDRGHEYEAAARPIAEEIVEDDLFPICVSANVDGLPLSASVDGATMVEDVIFEHKQPNTQRYSYVEGSQVVPPRDRPQLEQCLLLVGAKRALFMVSDGTRENERHVWYESDPALRAKIIPTWKQVAEDVKNYKHVDAPAAPIVAAPDELPSLAVTLFGGVKESNLADWQVIVIARIQAIKTDLQTDEDFALAAKTVTFLESGEKKLDLVKEQALSQTAPIDELFRTIDALKKQMRAKRLTLTNTIADRKQAVRDRIIVEGTTDFGNHVAALVRRIGQTMPNIPADFAGVCKGKSAVASLRNAVATELARAKIEANAVADRIEGNRKLFDELAADHRSLFADLSTLANNEPAAFEALVKTRIAEHVAEQERRAQVKRDLEAKAAAAQAAREQAEPVQKPGIVPPAVAAPQRAAAPVTPVGTWAESKRTPADAAPDPHLIALVVAGHFKASEAQAIAWIAAHEPWAGRTPAPVIEHRAQVGALV